MTRGKLSALYLLKNVFKKGALDRWRSILLQYKEWETIGNMKRKVKWWCHCKCTDKYGRIELIPAAYIQVLYEIEYCILIALKKAFPGAFDWIFDKNNFPNCCHGNYYTQIDDCGLHNDQEPIFDSIINESAIFSFSLGGTGTFDIYLQNVMQPNDNPLQRVILENGDICVMFGMFQRFYKHIAQSEDLRINLTFRNIRCHNKTCPHYAISN